MRKEAKINVICNKSLLKISADDAKPAVAGGKDGGKDGGKSGVGSSAGINNYYFTLRGR